MIKFLKRIKEKLRKKTKSEKVIFAVIDASKEILEKDANEIISYLHAIIDCRHRTIPLEIIKLSKKINLKDLKETIGILENYYNSEMVSK